jgi:hypothetical protein
LDGTCCTGSVITFVYDSLVLRDYLFDVHSLL